VGIYIRDGLNFKERKDLENYHMKTFENIVLEVFYPNKSLLISNIYRSPNPPPNTTVSQHFDIFFETLDNHLSKLSDQNKNVYVFTDSNINLLGASDQCTEYIDTLILNGFVQIISKATRIQNNKAALIDHIFTNTNQLNYEVGTIIDDLSDHFMNYLQISLEKIVKQNIKQETKRQINDTNTLNLKNALRDTDWSPVRNETDIDMSFNKFWDIFQSSYDEHFPNIHVRFNINKHKINGFMNNELFEARDNKLKAHKKSIKTKQPADHENYILLRNRYNTMLRQCKQKYYSDNLFKIEKMSKELGKY
jgi:hypothetical protein